MGISTLSCNNQASEGSGTSQDTFANPILVDGPDPYVYLHTDSLYYCMVTRGDRLQLWRSRSFTGLQSADTKTIWTPPDTGTNTCCIWAPEIHYFDDSWYIYYSATDKRDPVDLQRYVHVLRNASANPLEGSWEDLGKVDTHYPGIDGHVFHWKGVRYFAYSPYIGHQSGIVIAKMKSPTSLDQEKLLGLPVHPWEKTPPREILEGPQFLVGPKEKVFIIYSAGACWDDNYGLGVFEASKNADLLDPESWDRAPDQVFEQCPDSSVFGPGHNCFTTSPDYRQDWIVYHAKSVSSTECSGRSMRAQMFTWDAEGRPRFGRPVSTSARYNIPSGIIKEED